MIEIGNSIVQFSMTFYTILLLLHTFLLRYMLYLRDID